MAAQTITMEHIKQILRLKKDGFSIKAIARLIDISLPTVKKYLRRIIDASHGVKDLSQISDDVLAKIAFCDDVAPAKSKRYSQLHEYFIQTEKELADTGVTRQLLWMEYKEHHAAGYGYSQYCYYLEQFLRHKEVVMHLEHTAGETIMMDFTGKKMSYTDRSTGEIVPCETFLSVLPHSGLMFCDPVHTQNTLDLVYCLNAMMKYYGGVTLTVICDNLATAVKKADRYEPQFTDMCYQLSEHYNTTFSATRVRRPRDKAMIERMVQIAYTHIYAPLRKQTFFSIEELRHAMKERLEILNNKRFKSSVYSRFELFRQNEQQLLRPLPCEAFVLKKTRLATVQRNYHIQLTEDHRYYSVPYTYAGKKVKVLYDSKTVEIYFEQTRIAVHQRSLMTRAYITVPEHMPSNHQVAVQIKGWTSSDLLARAGDIGPCTQKAIEHILSGGIYPEQNYKSSHGVLMLQKNFGRQRLEAACARVLSGTRINYTMVKNILRCGLDKLEQTQLPEMYLPNHENIRGPEHYQ
jgi:transposase